MQDLIFKYEREDNMLSVEVTKIVAKMLGIIVRYLYCEKG